MMTIIMSMKAMITMVITIMMTSTIRVKVVMMKKVSLPIYKTIR